MTCAEILKLLESRHNPRNLAGMARYGIETEHAHGVPIPVLRRIARQIGKDHRLAVELWRSEVHEARILAGMVEDPALVTEAQMDRWARAFNSWDLCDQVCSNLFDRTVWAHRKAVEWTRREEPFVKRAGFVLMAALSVHDKQASDHAFIRFLPVLKREATDDRNYVKKAVNWALRQIGKRNAALNKLAVDTAREIQRIDSSAARWIASDALRELTNPKALKRLKAGGCAAG